MFLVWFKDQSFEEYYSTQESEETSQSSDLEDEENEVGRPDIYVTRSGRRSKPPERLIYDANACFHTVYPRCVATVFVFSLKINSMSNHFGPKRTI